MKYYTLLAISLGFLLWSGCDEDDPIDTAQLKFDFEFTVGNDPLIFQAPFEINGTTVSFDIAQYYIGGITLKHEDGQTEELKDLYLLAKQGESITYTEDLTVGSISEINFFVGVDPVTNLQSETDFTERIAEDPLALKDPSMHWNWNTGYKFLRVDGDADTDGDGEVDTGVAYHLGSAPFLKDFTVEKSMDLDAGSNTLSFRLDLAKLFAGVDMSTELDTHTSNNLPLAERLLENLGQALTLN